MTSNFLAGLAIALATAVMLFCSCATAQDHNDERKIQQVGTDEFEGLWTGLWGGGESDGVIFHPVVAQIMFDGNRVELSHFRNIKQISGTFKFDSDSGEMHIVRTANDGEQTQPGLIKYACELNDDTLTMVDSAGFPVTLERVVVTKNPLVNASVELLSTKGFNDEGDLIVTRYSVLEAGQQGVRFFEPSDYVLNTKDATILCVIENGCRELTIDEARSLVNESSMVAVTYRDEDRPASQRSSELWEDTGPVALDGQAARQTWSSTLRAGTLVFVLARQNVDPLP